MNQFSNTPSQNTRIFTIPNIITCIGILFAVGTGYCVFTKQYLLGFVFFIISAISDFFDGFTARHIEKKRPGYGTSRVGEILDPIRDKLLILAVVFINLKIGVLIIIAELVSILASYFAREAAGHHVITKTSKFVTTVQFILAPIFFLTQEEFLFFLFLIFSCLRGISYLFEFEKHKRKSPQ
ncbi:MAG: CDP-alcohol phosphatidyltransferase family protein [Patescibacteria group bacterium]